MIMPARDLTIWAREQLLYIIDDYLKSDAWPIEGIEVPMRMDFDDRRALEKERDRIAKFLKLPTKY